MNFLADYLGLSEIKFLPRRANASNFYRTHTSFIAYRLTSSCKVVKKKKEECCAAAFYAPVTAGLLSSTELPAFPKMGL